MAWKPEYAINRKIREAANPELRAKHLASAKTSQEKNQEDRKEYMKAYYAKHPEKFTKRKPENQAKHNAKRRMEYSENPELREKIKTQVKEWNAANPDKRKDSRLRKTHGISRVDFLELLAIQNNCCAICGYTSEKHGPMWPVVDHCHVTGKIRGLLCMNCNQALGKLKDNYANILTAAMYLQRNL